MNFSLYFVVEFYKAFEDFMKPIEENETYQTYYYLIRLNFNLKFLN